MAVGLEEQEVLISFTRADDEAIVQLPPFGFTGWRKVLEDAGIEPEVSRMDGEVSAYTYRVPKTWIRQPRPRRKRARKPSA